VDSLYKHLQNVPLHMVAVKYRVELQQMVLSDLVERRDYQLQYMSGRACAPILLLNHMGL